MHGLRVIICMKCKGVSAKLAVSGKTLNRRSGKKMAMGRNFTWVHSAKGEGGASPMGLGRVGGEGHRQAGLRLGHEEETGGGRSRPRVLRCDDDGEAAASSVGRRQIRRRGGPRRCSPTKRRRGDGSGEDEEAGGAGGPLQRGRGGSRRGRKNWRRGGRVRWVAAPRLARRDGLARR